MTLRAAPAWLALPAGDARVWRLWMCVRFATEAAARVVYSALLVDEDLQPDRMLRQLSTRGPVLDVVFGADAAKLLRVGIGSFLEYAQLAARAVEAFGDADVVTRPPAAAGVDSDADADADADADGAAVLCRVARVVRAADSDSDGDSGAEMVTGVLRSDAASTPLVSDALRAMQAQLNAELTRVVLATGATVDDDDNDQQFGEDVGEPASSSSSSSDSETEGASSAGARRAPARRGRKRAAPTS